MTDISWVSSISDVGQNDLSKVPTRLPFSRRMSWSELFARTRNVFPLPSKIEYVGSPSSPVFCSRLCEARHIPWLSVDICCLLNDVAVTGMLFIFHAGITISSEVRRLEE